MTERKLVISSKINDLVKFVTERACFFELFSNLKGVEIVDLLF